MRGQLGNDIAYSGELTIKLKSNNNVVLYKSKNAGCKPLWDAIARAFVGEDIKNYIPKYLLVVDPSTTIPVMVGPVPFTGRVWGDVVEKSTDSTSVRYTATVTAAEKIGDCTSPDGVLTVQMLNSDSTKTVNDDGTSTYNNIMASITDEIICSAWEKLLPGIDIIFEWKLTFSNKEVTDRDVP